MTNITIILDSDGQLESVFSDDEVVCHILMRGINDLQIDAATIILEEVELIEGK